MLEGQERHHAHVFVSLSAAPHPGDDGRRTDQRVKTDKLIYLGLYSCIIFGIDFLQIFAVIAIMNVKQRRIINFVRKDRLPSVRLAGFQKKPKRLRTISEHQDKRYYGGLAEWPKAPHC